MRNVTRRYFGYDHLTDEHWFVEEPVLVISERVIMYFQDDTLTVEHLSSNIDSEAEVIETHYDDNDRKAFEFELPMTFIKSIDLPSLAKLSVAEAIIHLFNNSKEEF